MAPLPFWCVCVSGERGEHVVSSGIMGKYLACEVAGGEVWAPSGPQAV